MNLLALIIILLAVITSVAIAYIAWELSADKTPPPAEPPDAARGEEEPGD